jgi:phage gp36-like protein
MSWRAITETDLLQRMNSDELTELRETGLASGQSDPVAEQIEQVINFVRGYISANPANTLGPDGTLPERLIRPACDILVIDVSSRSAGFLMDLSETRKTAKSDAIRLLEQVAAGNYAIESPDTEGTDTRTPQTPLMYEKTRTYTRDDQEGI